MRTATKREAEGLYLQKGFLAWLHGDFCFQRFLSIFGDANKNSVIVSRDAPAAF